MNPRQFLHLPTAYPQFAHSAAMRLHKQYIGISVSVSILSVLLTETVGCSRVILYSLWIIHCQMLTKLADQDSTMLKF